MTEPQVSGNKAPLCKLSGWDWEEELKPNEKIARCKDRRTGRLAARKIIMGSSTPVEVRILSEIHQNNRTVALLDHVMDQPKPLHCSLYFEYFPLGDLKKWRFDEFHLKNTPVPESHIWRFFVQMAQALAFLHSGYGTGRMEKWNGIIHRDIKPENIMMVDNHTLFPSFKLHDFGVAERMDRILTLESKVGSHLWQPAELPRINTKEADVWSLGAVGYFLARGHAPTAELYPFVLQTRRNNGDKLPAEVESLPESERRFHWCSKVPRQIVPINTTGSGRNGRMIGLNGIPMDSRELDHAYSTDLNDRIMAILKDDPGLRPTALQLVDQMVPAAKLVLSKMGDQSTMIDLEFKCER